MAGPTRDQNSDLRPLIARLREIMRKCASLGSRNEEFPEMEQRVARIIQRLEAAQNEPGDDVDFRLIARDLFPVAHLFESTGFMSVGKEVAHIERSLVAMAPEAAQTPVTPAGSSAVSPTTSTAAVRSAEPDRETEPESKPSGSVPVPVGVGFIILVAAAAVSAMIIFRVGPFSRPPMPVSEPQGPALAATPTRITPTHPPQETVPIPATTPTRPIPRGRLAGEIASARLALAKGDLDQANTHLTEAARIDRKDADLVEIAGDLVARRVETAIAAAQEGRWTDAAEILERADRLAMRFGIDGAPIESARTHIADMERYVLIDPADRRGISGGIGRTADITLDDGSVITGRIAGLSGDNLRIDIDDEVDGGIVRFTEEIHLSRIRSIKIPEN